MKGLVVMSSADLSDPDGERPENGPTADGQWWKSLADEHTPVALKTDQPHSARMYDYYLGGKDNFPVDREAAEQALSVFPNARVAARQNREFMIRATRYLAGEVGIRQFLDIGTGIPTSPNLHEVAQSVVPDARVVYADNDPIVLAQDQASHQHLLAIGPTPGSAPALHMPYGSDAGSRPPHRRDG